MNPTPTQTVVKYRITVAVLLILVALLSAALVRAENQRYGLSLGMCVDKRLGAADYPCLEKLETRTAWYWHIYYGLTN